MTSHDDMVVEMVMAKQALSVLKGIDYHAREFWFAQGHRTGATLVKNTVHREKGFSRSSC